MREKIRELACNFSGLWHAPATPQRERKRMVHLLLEDVTLMKNEENITVHVRFKAGATRTLHLAKPLTSWQEWTTDSKIVTEIDRLLDHHTNSEIASILNQRGFKSGMGKPCHGNRISKIRRAYGLKSLYERLQEVGMLTRKELAATRGVNRITVTKWRLNGRLKAHLAEDQGQYLYEDPGDACLRLKKKKDKKYSVEHHLLTKVSCRAKEV